MPHRIGCKHCKGVSQKQFGKNQYLAREDTDHITNHVCPQHFKLKREDVTGQETGQNANVHLQPWDDKQFELKCPDWKLWAYTDGSCIGKAKNFAGREYTALKLKLNVMWTQEAWEWKTPSMELSSQGLQQRLPLSNTKIATDSACSPSQIRIQVLCPEMQRVHIHSNLLEQIVSMIMSSPKPICFYKVKAHSCIAGNECADAFAKHSASHDGGHDMHLQPPAPDNNAYTHLYWLAAKDTDENPSGRGTTTPRLRALSDIKAKLKTEMCKSHRLGSAKTNTGYYSYWKDLRPNKQATNAFWNTSNLKFYKKRNVMRYRTGAIFNKKHAYRYSFSPNANCPICPCTDSALHILSGCQHTKTRNMNLKRHNTASVLIAQALQKGPCGANQIAYTDVGSADKLSEQGLDLRNPANKTLPSWLLPKPTAHALKASSRPNAILFLPSTVCSSRLITRNPNFQQLAIL